MLNDNLPSKIITCRFTRINLISLKLSKKKKKNLCLAAKYCCASCNEIINMQWWGGGMVIQHRIMTNMSFGGNKWRLDSVVLTLSAFLCYLQVLGVRVFLSPTFMAGGWREGERIRIVQRREIQRGVRGKAMLWN